MAVIGMIASILLVSPYRIEFVGKYGQKAGQRVFVLLAVTAVSGSIFAASLLAIFGRDSRGFEWVATIGDISGTIFAVCVLIMLVSGLLISVRKLFDHKEK